MKIKQLDESDKTPLKVEESPIVEDPPKDKKPLKELPLGKRTIEILHEALANITWIRRGMIVDDDFQRMNRDWLYARRIVGYKLADEILKGCKNGICYSVPDYYFPYLNCISLNEFKEIKAYLIWVQNRNRWRLSDDETKVNYLYACEEIEQNKINCSCSYDIEIPTYIKKYISESKKNHFEAIIRRKAYWNGIFERNQSGEYNWEKAKNFVNAIYKPLDATNKLNKEEVLNIINLIDGNHHLTNMFEYSIRCNLFRHVGLTRSPSPDERQLTYCAKTGEQITKGN
jgi:hypothetical protein